MAKQKAEPTPFGADRAAQIWADKLPFGEFRGITLGEDAYVDSLPGRSWIEAFFGILNGRTS